MYNLFSSSLLLASRVLDQARAILYWPESLARVLKLLKQWSFISGQSLFLYFLNLFLFFIFYLFFFNFFFFLAN